MNITYRPIDKWPGTPTKARQASPFSAPWNATLELLDRELWYLEAKNVVFQIALREEDFRRTDGQPKTNARASHPGVILVFDSKFGPLKYACDTFHDFQSNVRAIALGLEALRKVDRYGITKRGEQYTGWKALPATTAEPVITVEQAAVWLAMAAGLPTVTGDMIMRDADVMTQAYRAAVKRVHPDVAGGHRTADFQRLQEAKRILDIHHGGAHG